MKGRTPMRLRPVALAVIGAVLLLLSSLSIVNANPPGPGDCSHGNSGQPCRPDPQPSHGQDCEPHGNGGVNEDHCLPEVTPSPSPTPTPTATPSPSPDPTPTATPSATPTSSTPTLTPTPEPTPTSSDPPALPTPIDTFPPEVTLPPTDTVPIPSFNVQANPAGIAFMLIGLTMIAIAALGASRQHRRE